MTYVEVCNRTRLIKGRGRDDAVNPPRVKYRRNQQKGFLNASERIVPVHGTPDSREKGMAASIFFLKIIFTIS